MAVSLKKGQGVNLRKSEYDLSQVTIGLGWDVAQPSGVFKFLKSQEEYDLDAIAFLLDERGRVARRGSEIPGQQMLVGGDIVFFNSMKHDSGCVWLTGDNRTGAGDGDDEQIIVRLESLPAQYARIVFVVQIYQGIQKGQNFGKVKNAFIRAVDRGGREMCRFDLSGDKSYAGHHSLLFAELSRQGGEWTFTAIGKPYEADSFVHILKEYL